MKLGELIANGISPETQKAIDNLVAKRDHLQKCLAPIQDVIAKQSTILNHASRPYLQVLNQYSKYLTLTERHLRGLRNLNKNLNGLSVSFLVQSQVVTKELTYPKKDSETREINTPQKIDLTPIDEYATKSDIQEISKRIANLETVRIEQTRQEYKLEINQQDCQERLLWLTMSGNRLMINDTIAYHTFKTNSDDRPSINSRLINHLISNPHTEFSRQDLMDLGILNKNEDKDFNICLQDMKFVDEFAKLFFKTSKNSIELTNPITPEIKDKKGIEFVELSKILKKKK